MITLLILGILTIIFGLVVLIWPRILSIIIAIWLLILGILLVLSSFGFISISGLAVAI